MSTTEADDEISLLDLALVVVENLRLLVLGPLAAGLVALGISFLIPPTFTAKTQFLPPQQQQSAAASMLASLGSLGGLAGAAAGIKNPSDQYLAFLKSVSLQDALIDRFDLVKRFQVENRTDARRVMEGGVRTSSGKDGLIAVEVDDKDPKFAADLANAHVEELRKLLGRLAVTEAQQRRVFFEKQLQEARGNLAKSESALRSTGVSESLLKSNPTAALAGVAALKAQVTAQEVKVGAMRNYLSESAPEFRSALNDLTNLRGVLAKQQTAEEPSIKNADGSYIQRYRDFKYFETLYELYAKQFEIARVDEAREGAVIQVLDAAQTPERKSKPKKALIALVSTLAAGFGLLLFVFVRNAIKKSQVADPRMSQLHLAFKKAFGKN
jgi:uncharacterized protein involved in exopolysaccharide biosynthesis